MPRPVIVNHQSLQMGLESGLESAGSGALEARGTALSSPEMVAELSHALRLLEAEQGAAGVMTASRDQATSLLQTFLARQALEEQKVDEGSSGALEARFDQRDFFGWAGSFFDWWKKLAKHDFVDWDGRVDRLPNRTRIAVLSDWGSGLYGAPPCQKSIEADAGGFDLVFHLGDVYYAGDDDEVRDRFLAFWPRVDGALSRALNGNHEMYTGGRAYFKQALAQFGQPSSFCALENDHWVLVGMDTAYKDHRLHGKQRDWIRQLVGRAAGRKVVLFSHHQPYSILEALKHGQAGQERGLIKDLGEFLANRQIYAWYWGHEHHCVIYDDHPFWGLKGRCVGHSGFPEFRPTKVLGDDPGQLRFRRLPTRNLVPGGLVLDGPNPHVAEAPEKYAPHGYVVLELDGDRLLESYHEAAGDLLHQVELR